MSIILGACFDIILAWFAADDKKKDALRIDKIRNYVESCPFEIEM